MKVCYDVPGFPSPWRFYLAPFANLLETLSGSVVSLLLAFGHKEDNVDPLVLSLDRFRNMTRLYAATPETLRAVLSSVHKFDNGGQAIFPALEKLGLVLSPPCCTLPSATFEKLIKFLKWHGTGTTGSGVVSTVEVIQPWLAYDLVYVGMLEFRTLRTLVDKMNVFYFVDHVLLSTDFREETFIKGASKGYPVALRVPAAEWVVAYPRSLDDDVANRLRQSSLL